jgi:hypothetical protein
MKIPGSEPDHADTCLNIARIWANRKRISSRFKDPSDATWSYNGLPLHAATGRGLDCPASLVWRSRLFRLPQFYGLSLRVMEAGKAAVWIELWINLNLDSLGSELSDHLVEVPYSKVHHPELVRVPKIVTRLGKRAEDLRPCLLLPNRFLLARGRQRNSQGLPVPASQRFRIVRSEEYPADAGNFLHFTSSGRFELRSGYGRSNWDRWVCGSLYRKPEFLPAQDEALPEA